MDHFNFKPIGIIHSPFRQLDGMPIQPSAAKGIKGNIILDNQYVDGLCDLAGFSHIYLLYHFHLSKSFRLKVKPFLDDQPRGLFSTRSPNRPNPIGLSVVKLLKIKNNFLEIENVDIMDGTPLLDIKPYVHEMNAVKNCKVGWLTEHLMKLKTKKADKRFQ